MYGTQDTSYNHKIDVILGDTLNICSQILYKNT